MSEIEVKIKNILLGRTIKGVVFEDIEGDESYQRLTLETDQGPVVLQSQDYEGYRSWIRLVEK